MFLAFSIGLNVFDLFYRRRTPSIWQGVSLDTTKREAADDRHEDILDDAGDAPAHPARPSIPHRSECLNHSCGAEPMPLPYKRDDESDQRREQEGITADIA